MRFGLLRHPSALPQTSRCLERARPSEMLPCDRTDRLIGLPSALGLRAKRAPSDGISVVGACLTSPRPPISARRRQRWSVRNSPDVSSRYDACHSEVSLRAAAVRLLAIKETAAGSLRKQELFSCSFRPRANNRNFSASERHPAVLVSKAQLTVDVRLGGAGAAFTSGGGGVERSGDIAYYGTHRQLPPRRRPIRS